MVGQDGAGGLHAPNPVELVPKNVFEDAQILDQNMVVNFAQAKRVTKGIVTRNSALVKFRCDCTKWKNFVTLSCNVLVMGKMGFPLKRPFRKNFMNGYGNRLTQMYFIVYCCFLFSLVRSVSFLCFVCFLSHFFFCLPLRTRCFYSDIICCLIGV